MSDHESWRLAAFAADSGLKKKMKMEKTEKVETKMKKTEMKKSEEKKSVESEERRVGCREYDLQADDAFYHKIVYTRQRRRVACASTYTTIYTLQQHANT